jgi:hypothetical protein
MRALRKPPEEADHRDPHQMTLVMLKACSILSVRRSLGIKAAVPTTPRARQVNVACAKIDGEHASVMSARPPTGDMPVTMPLLTC